MENVAARPGTKPVTRRIYVSMPADVWLTPAQNNLKWGVVAKIEELGYVPEIFTDPTGRESLSAAKTWSASDADEIARHCQGAALIGLPRWVFGAADGTVFLPTEYCHYEEAIARTLGLPLLILVQDNLMRRVVFDPHFGPYVGVFPEGAERSWLDTKEFEVCFRHWCNQLKTRRDVFLGYCGPSPGIASRVRILLEQEIGVTVLDWQRDFKPARTILEQIEEARVRCTAGVFLFTKDDELKDATPGKEAAPRDNVVFEAGYFASAKGKSRVLVIRESGAKMPADLGGDIYASLEDRNDVSTVEQTVRRFVASL